MRDAGYQAEISNGASLGNAGVIVIAISTSPKWDSPSGVAYMRRHLIPGLQSLHLGRRYSITRSARSKVGDGTVRSKAFAVFRLTTRENRVGCSTGISLGFAPFRILSTSAVT